MLIRNCVMQKGEKMKIFFETQSSEVTGSSHLVTIIRDNKPLRILVDCGKFQGEAEKEKNRFFGFEPDKIDVVFVTHAHYDHIGRIPQLIKSGFKGIIISNEVTRRRAQISLGRSNNFVFSQWKHVEETFLYSFSREIKFAFFKNAHIAGATALFLRVENHNYSENYLFTGDYLEKSNFAQTWFPEWVYRLPLTIVAETTYGTGAKKEHGKFERELKEWMRSPSHTAVVPVFAMERGQVILKKIGEMQKKRKISANIPIFIQGESLVDYTNQYLAEGLIPYQPNVIPVPTNVGIRTLPQYKIVVTTPGMGKDGASRTWIEHAKKNKNIMLFKVGYAPETAPMGRLGQMNVKFMETNEFGSHCAGEEMIEFLSRFECIKNVILVHGNMSTKKIMFEAIRERRIASKVWILEPGEFIWKDLNN